MSNMSVKHVKLVVKWCVWLWWDNAIKWISEVTRLAAVYYIATRDSSMLCLPVTSHDKELIHVG